MNYKISDKDKEVWENFLSKDEKLPNKDFELNQKKNQKTKRLDLHGFSLDEANKEIEKFINKSFEENISKITVVTGKGLHSDVDSDPYVSKDLSTLKYSVPEFIENNSELMKMIIKIEEADISDGGSGAFYIFLKKKLQNKFR